MLTAKARLNRLLALAAKDTAEARQSLTAELAAFLKQWPKDLPPDMRESLESLLQQKRRQTLAGNLDERALLSVARGHVGTEWAVEFAGFVGVDLALARRILAEPTGQALAVACKAAYLSRAAFSTLAVLSARTDRMSAEDSYTRLAAYDNLSRSDAITTLESWRKSEAKAA